MEVSHFAVPDAPGRASKTAHAKDEPGRIDARVLVPTGDFESVSFARDRVATRGTDQGLVVRLRVARTVGTVDRGRVFRATPFLLP